MKSKLPILKDKCVVREVYIGGFSKEELLKRLEESEISVNELALEIINHKEFRVFASREKLQAVEISVSDLGFSRGATVDEIYQAANKFGLRLCPPELGIHLRLQYIDFTQPVDPPKGNWQSIALEEFFEQPEFTLGFYLRRRKDGFWLRGYRASRDYLWDPVDRFIFVIE